jgi:hypothetical protein
MEKGKEDMTAEKLKFDLNKGDDKISAEDRQAIFLIAKNAWELGAQGSPMTVAMDIKAGVLAYGISIKKLAKFDKFNLMHDVLGLQSRINRKEKFFTNDLWLPRSV